MMATYLEARDKLWALAREARDSGIIRRIPVEPMHPFDERTWEYDASADHFVAMIDGVAVKYELHQAGREWSIGRSEGKESDLPVPDDADTMAKLIEARPARVVADGR